MNENDLTDRSKLTGLAGDVASQLADAAPPSGMPSSGMPSSGISARSILGEGLETTIVHTWPWPNWVALLLLAAAAALVIYCYARERTSASPPLKVLLSGIRIALIGLVVLMMYGWMQHRYRTDLPDLVVMLDDSASMNLEDFYSDADLKAELIKRIGRSGFDVPSRWNLARTLLLENDGRLLEELQRRYNVKIYLVGGTARAFAESGPKQRDALRDWRAKQDSSRLGQGLRDVLQMQRGRPSAAIIVLTDGVTTEGRSLGEMADYARRKSVPLFIVGLGTDQSPRDVRVSDLLVDEVAFVGDLLQFDFKVSATGYQGKPVVVQLKRDGQSSVLAEERLTIKQDGQPQSARLAFRPPEEGDYRFVVEAEALDGEANVKNNRQSRVVRVRDETIRVLYVQEYPSFDFRFLKNLLGRGLKRTDGEKSISLTTVLQEADLEYAEQDETARRVFPVSRDELFEYDVIIFGDVNPSYLSQSVMENVADFVKQRGGGLIVLAGPRHTPLAFRGTPLESLMPIALGTASLPPAGAPLAAPIAPRLTQLGASSPQLQLADSFDASLRAWRSLPPIYWMMEAPDIRPATRVLVEHPTLTGSSGQNLPLICMQFVGAGKVVFHATDESYRWSRDPRGSTFYNRYWIQTLRYLSRSKLLGTGRKAEMTADREVYRRGEPVRLRVRFFDDRLAPPQDDGVIVIVEREEGRRRQLNLRRDAASRGIFEGAMSDLPEGSYRAWMATPTTEGQPPARRFDIVAPPGEQSRLEMDAEDLIIAAKHSRGRYYTMNTVGRLTSDLPRGRQVRIEPLPPTPVWNFWLLPLAFVGLIVTEWLIRKRVGML